MKKLFSLLLLIVGMQVVAQTTYTWTGGVTRTNTDWSVSTNWSPSRTTPANTDKLIFDGATVAAVSLTNVPYQTVNSLSLVNNASVTFSTVTTPVKGGGAAARLGTAVTGSVFSSVNTNFNTTFAVGEFMTFTSSAKSSMSQIIAINSATSLTTAESGTITSSDNYYKATQLKITGTLNVANGCSVQLAANYGFAISMQSGATASVYGAITQSTVSQRITAVDPMGLQFFSGSSFTVSGAADGYAFGQYPNNTSYNNVVFQAGSTYNYNTNASFSPFGIAQQQAEPTGVVMFAKGSKVVYNAIPSSSGAKFFSGRTYGNLVINANIAIDGNCYSVDTLTVNNGFTFTLSNAGAFPVTGDVVNNGTITVASPTSCNLAMLGVVPQSISGSGTYALAGLTIASKALVTLNTSITTNTVGNALLGQLNFNGYTISGNAAFTSRSATSNAFTATTTAGSNTISVVSSFSNIISGMLVTGAGIPDNSFVIGTNSGAATFTINNVATTTATNVSISVSRGNSTLSISSASGLDGNLTTTGSKSFAAANYIFNTTTTTPFASTLASVSANKVILNAPISLVTNLSLADSLVLNNNNIALNGKTVTINTTGVCAAGTGQLTGTGSVIVNGTLSTGHTAGIVGTIPSASFTLGSTATVDYSGSSTQTIDARTDFYNLTISGNRGGATITLPAATIGVGNLFVAKATNVVYVTTNNTIDLSSKSPTVGAFAYNNLLFSGATSAPKLTGNVTVNGTFYLSTIPVGLALNDYSLTINGAISGLGTVSGSALSSLYINGSSFCSILFTADSQVLNQLTINNPNGFVLESPLTINGTLTLNSGLLQLGVHDLTIASSAVINGASANSYVAVNGTGKLVRNGVNSSTVFPVGTAISYTPITLTPANQADIAVSLGVDARLATASNAAVNVVWNIASSIATQVSMVFQFTGADMGVDFNPAMASQLAISGNNFSSTNLGTPAGTDPYTVTKSGVALLQGTISCAIINAGSVNTATTTNWTGLVSQDWDVAANWDNGVPNSALHANIPNTAQLPIVTMTRSVNNLTIQSGVVLSNHSVLQVKGALTNNGSISCNGITLLNGTALQQIKGLGAINKLAIDNSNGVSMPTATDIQVVDTRLFLRTGDLLLTGSLTVNGTVERTDGTMSGKVPNYASNIDVLYNGSANVTAGNELHPATGSIGTLTIQSMGTTYSISDSVAVSNLVRLSSGRLAVTNGGILNFPTTVIREIGELDASAANATVVINKNVMVPAATFNPTVIGKLVVNAAAPTFIQDLVVGQQLLLQATNSGTYAVGGKLTMASGASYVYNKQSDDGSVTLATAPSYEAKANFLYKGLASIVVGNEIVAGSSVVNNLTIDNSGGVTFLAAGTIPLQGNLTLSNGTITLDNTSLELNNVPNGKSSSYVRTVNSGQLVGKNVGATPVLFPVGNKDGYTPVTVTNTSGTTNFSASVADIVSLSVADASKIINAQWRLLATNAARVNLGFQFSDTNRAASFSTTGVCEIGQYETSYKLQYVGIPSIVSAGVYALQNLAIDLTNGVASDFVIGNLNAVRSCTTGSYVGIDGGDANNGSNWCGGAIPSATTDVIISQFTPRLTNNLTVRNLALHSGIALSGYSLTINGAVSGNGTIKGSDSAALNMLGTGTLYFDQTKNDTTNVLSNLIVNTSGTVTLGNPLKVKGMLRSLAGTLASGGNLTLVASAARTARIPQMGGNISGDVTTQLYIPAKSTREKSMIGSAVSQLIQNAWQQQIYITGAGIGGVICGTGSSKYNSNGFDPTATNFPSMYQYLANPISGTRWASLDNTNNTNLVPGKGYRLVIRGDRNQGTCQDQLNSLTPAPPTSVVLSATGKLSQGNVPVALYDTTDHLYTLVANPFPNAVSFSQLASHNPMINNKMWTYSPYGNGNYTTYSNGVIANGATGYNNTNGDVLGIGQAFFVESNGLTNTLTFAETDKTDATAPSWQYFGTANKQLLRVQLKSDSIAILDEAIIRFNPYGAKQYLSAWDAVTFSGSTKSVAVKKAKSRLAIATFPENASTDTIALSVKSSSVGSFMLDFNGIDALDSTKTYWLYDAYLKTSQNLRTLSVYNFNITADSLSKGDLRFVLIGKPNGTTLPLLFVKVSATANAERNATVIWQVQEETKVANYLIERSTDGRTFRLLTNQKAVGAGIYKMVDAQLPTEATILYYRIVALSGDGQSTYSPVAKVQVGEKRSIRLFPNPVSDRFVVQLPVQMAKQMFTVNVRSMDGKLVWEKHNVTANSNQQLPLSAASWATGVYVLEIQTTDGNIWTSRLQVVR